MELYQLRSFIAVARENHLTRAAHALHISQPAVSAHIKALEEEFGQLLFTRTPKGMKLTPSGTLLYAKAQQIVDHVGELANLAEGLQQQPVGTLKVGLNRDSAFLQIRAVYQRLLEQYPGLELQLHQAVSATIVKMIRTEELDCGFVLGDRAENDFVSLVLAQLSLCVVAPISIKEDIFRATQEELAEFPWIGNPKDSPYSGIMETFFYCRGIKPKSTVVADQQSAIISMIKAGVGLSFMLEGEAQIAEQQGVLTIWPGRTFPVNLCFISRKKAAHSCRIQAMIKVLKSVWPEAARNSFV